MPDEDRSYEIERTIEGGYLARTPSGSSALLITVVEVRAPPGRASGDLRLTFQSDVRFDLPDGVLIANSAVIECVNDALENTFVVLAENISASLAATGIRPTPQDVSRELARWEELLRAKRALSREEEIGLWGELWMILKLPQIDDAVSAWRGPGGESIDFVGGGIGMECKASMHRLEHYVSQDQVTRPLGDLEIYFQSLWLDQDSLQGESIVQLIARIDSLLTDRHAFEEKLLATGYSRSDASRYELKLRILERPLLFPESAIPRVRTADAGVSRIRYLAFLQEDQALDDPTALAVTMKLCSSPHE